MLLKVIIYKSSESVNTWVHILPWMTTWGRFFSMKTQSIGDSRVKENIHSYKYCISTEEEYENVLTCIPWINWIATNHEDWRLAVWYSNRSVPGHRQRMDVPYNNVELAALLGLKYGSWSLYSWGQLMHTWNSKWNSGSIRCMEIKGLSENFPMVSALRLKRCSISYISL